MSVRVNTYIAKIIRARDIKSGGNMYNFFTQKKLVSDLGHTPFYSWISSKTYILFNFNKVFQLILAGTGKLLSELWSESITDGHLGHHGSSSDNEQRSGDGATRNQSNTAKSVSKCQREGDI